MLTNSAMLVSLSIGQPSLTRKDKGATADVTTSHNAENGAVAVVKVLFDPKDYKPIQALVTQIRQTHYARTLPWLDSGARILSSTGFLKYTEEMSNLRSQFDRLTAAFCDEYQGKLDRARVRLNGLWKASDYPSAEEVRERFGFDVAYFPIPESGDFRIEGISEIHKAAIQADIDKRQHQAIQEAMKDVGRRIREAVGSLRDKMKEKRQDKAGNDIAPIFRDSIISNIEDLVDLLPSLNLTGDPEISAITEELKKSLVGINPADLRESDAQRKTAARKADAIMKKMAGLY